MRPHRITDISGRNQPRLALATAVSFLALGLHQGSWIDLSFLNPLHLQGCGGNISYLQGSSIPEGTERKVVLVGQGEGDPDLRIFPGAQLLVRVKNHPGARGPFGLGGYHPGKDALILGDRSGGRTEIPVDSITALTVVHPNSAQKGAEDGALYGGLAGAALLTALLTPELGGEAVGFGLFCGGLMGSGTGALAGAVAGSSGVYDEVYAIDDEHWLIAYEPGPRERQRATSQPGGGGRVQASPPIPGGTTPSTGGPAQAGATSPMSRCTVAARYHLKRPIGCPCERREQCATSHCLPVSGISVCTQICSTECPDGFTCQAMRGSGGQGLCVRGGGPRDTPAVPVEPKPAGSGETTTPAAP